MKGNASNGKESKGWRRKANKNNGKGAKSDQMPKFDENYK